MTKEFPTAIIALAEKWAREANAVPPDVHPNHIANILQLSPFGPDVDKENWKGWVKLYRGYRDQENHPQQAADLATKEWFEMLPEAAMPSITPVPMPPSLTRSTLTITFYVETFQSKLELTGASGTELLSKYLAALTAIKNIGGQPWHEARAVVAPSIPIPQPSTPAPTNVPPPMQYPQAPPVVPQPQTTNAPVCPYHGKPMKPSQFKPEWYCTAKMPDGSYCTHKVPYS